MRTKSTHFVDPDNALSAWKRRKKGLTQINPAKMLKDAVKINLDKLPLTGGKIHFIRKVDNEGKISVLNEVLTVGKVFIGECVRATICLAERKMKVYYRAKDQDAIMLIKKFDCTVNEAISPLRQDIWKS